MITERRSLHGMWSTRLGFILAATGSAVGLGNVWKFPYIVGENGGGAFVLVYLACVALIGIPIMMVEILVGRRGRHSPIVSMEIVAREEGRTTNWKLVGWMGVLGGFMILSYYSVIAGWALSYVFRAGFGVFDGMTADGIGAKFSELVSDPEKLIAWHTIFMLITMGIIAQGVEKGLERSVTYMMPALAGILIVLVAYAVQVGSADEGIRFLFYPDFSALTRDSVLIAMGHAFFTLSLGVGAIMMYGAYLPSDVSITRSSIIIALADTVIALLAGLAIFPIVFAYGLEPDKGPGLIFTTLPVAFGQMPWGGFFGTLFFILLTFAALTSAISLIEPAVAWLIERGGLTRIRAAMYTGVVAWLIGLGSVFSFNLWKDETLTISVGEGANEIKLVNEASFFNVMEYVTSNVMLPLGGLLIALFVGWAMRRESVQVELGISNPRLFQAWRFIMRYVTPVLVLFVFLNSVGLLG
jgi:NSS family neurotransmitter:Na+ symporter